MEKDFEEFVMKRCEKALLESEEYVNMEAKDAPQDELQMKAEVLCYKQCFNDFLSAHEI